MSLSLGLGMLARGQRGGRLWSPAALFRGGANGFWHDPFDRATLFQDAAGAVPVTADGQNVRRINDKSGRGHPLIFPTDANRPVYRTDGVLHWLELSGAGAFPSPASLTAAPRPTSDLWVGAFRHTETSATQVHVHTFSDGLIVRRTFDGRLSIFAGGAYQAGSAGGVAAGQNVVLGRTNSGGRVVGRVNGVQQIDAVSTIAYGAFNGHVLANYAGTAERFVGRWYGAIFVADPPNPAGNLARAEQWMGQRCGVMQ